MAVIRYIAFISEKPEELAKFYNRFLGTRELERSPEGDLGSRFKQMGKGSLIRQE